MDARELVGEREDRPEPEPESEPNPNLGPNLHGCRRCGGPCASLEPNGRAAKVRRGDVERRASTVERRGVEQDFAGGCGGWEARVRRAPCAMGVGLPPLFLDW